MKLTSIVVLFLVCLGFVDAEIQKMIIKKKAVISMTNLKCYAFLRELETTTGARNCFEIPMNCETQTSIDAVPRADYVPVAAASCASDKAFKGYADKKWAQLLPTFYTK